jgi:hypothetical protein
MASSVGFHEACEKLSAETLERHRATASLQEELEAVDWYDQRIDATGDAELRAILIHNRDEEKEHAAMMLEWLRRRDPTFDQKLREQLFTTHPLGQELHQEEGEHGSRDPESDGSLGIGSLRRHLDRR